MRLPRVHAWISATAGAFLLAAAGGCGGAASRVPVAPAGWADSVRADRAAKDAEFRGPRSPLTPAQRAEFTGLHYFPPDPEFRFLAKPDRDGAGDAVTLMDTRGNVRHYRVAYRLHLTRDASTFTLTVYRSPDNPELFLPFQDATTGDETYPVGRYVPVEQGPPGWVLVDFNRAYNPYCAYNDRWACPLVPPENRIPVAIRAGETKYHD